MSTSSGRKRRGDNVRETVLEEGAELLQNCSARSFRGKQNHAIVLHDGLESFQVDENGSVPYQKAR
jgi:hypothetical protein